MSSPLLTGPGATYMHTSPTDVVIEGLLTKLRTSVKRCSSLLDAYVDEL